MAKKIKITEKQLQEFIDNEGSIVSGDYDGSDSKIRTNYYRKNKRPQTSDDFADETGQNTKWYMYRGLSISESDEKVEEAIVNNNKTNEVISTDVEAIPDPTELSKSYEQPQIQNYLDNLSTQLTSLGVDEQDDKDIKAIVLKQILSIVNIAELNPQQQKEIRKMIR